MDRFFASVPGPTWPNRMFALTGTSAGELYYLVFWPRSCFLGIRLQRHIARRAEANHPSRTHVPPLLSAGSTSTSVWYDDLGGKLYPQETFYDQVEQTGACIECVMSA